MLVSVITSTYNAARALAVTADSVRRVRNARLEWVIVDGASSDDTVSVIQANNDIVSKWVSTADKGIYDAWNKGCQLATGQWLLFLGAGDSLDDRFDFPSVASSLDSLPKEITVAYGDVDVVNAAGEVLFTHQYKRMDLWECGRPALPCHQGVFQRREAVMQELFDISYKVAADSKFLLKQFKERKPTYLNQRIGRMELMGVSTHPKNAMLVARELTRLRAEFGLHAPAGHLQWFHLKSMGKCALASVLPDRWFLQTVNGYRRLTGRTAIY